MIMMFLSYLTTSQWSVYCVLCTVLAIISWHTWLDCSDSEYVVDGVDELQRLASFEY